MAKKKKIEELDELEITEEEALNEVDPDGAFEALEEDDSEENEEDSEEELEEEVLIPKKKVKASTQQVAKQVAVQPKATVAAALNTADWTPSVKKSASIPIPARVRKGKWTSLSQLLKAGECVDNMPDRKSAIGLAQAIKKSGGEAQFRELNTGLFAVWKLK